MSEQLKVNFTWKERRRERQETTESRKPCNLAKACGKKSFPLKHPSVNKLPAKTAKIYTDYRAVDYTDKPSVKVAFSQVYRWKEGGQC